MTTEEAIKSLKGTLKVRTDAYYDYLQSGGKADCGEEYGFDVLETAIEALKKQIPKKPQKKSCIWLCPSCHNECYWDTDYGQQQFDFCPYCGQALDWSES